MPKDFLRRLLQFAGRSMTEGAMQRISGPSAAEQLVERVLERVNAQGSPAVANLEGILAQTRQLESHLAQTRQLSALAFEDRLLEDQLGRFGPLFVAKHNTHMFSQTYEDAAIAEIFSRIGTTSKTFIEIGVEDGSENTTRLLLMLGWRGLWIEGSSRHCATIRDGFADDLASGKLQLINAMAAPDTIQSLVDASGFGPQIDFLSIDVDQHTSHLYRAITTRSRVVCLEYNAHLPPSIDYEVPYHPNEVWDGSNCFGASLKRLEIDAAQRGMSLVGCDLMGVNAYFVDHTLTGDLFPKPFTAEHHYQPPRYGFIRGSRGHRRKAARL